METTHWPVACNMCHFKIKRRNGDCNATLSWWGLFLFFYPVHETGCLMWRTALTVDRWPLHSPDHTSGIESPFDCLYSSIGTRPSSGRTRIVVLHFRFHFHSFLQNWRKRVRGKWKFKYFSTIGVEELRCSYREINSLAASSRERNLLAESTNCSTNLQPVQWELARLDNAHEISMRVRKYDPSKVVQTKWCYTGKLHAKNFYCAGKIWPQVKWWWGVNGVNNKENPMQPVHKFTFS